MDLKQSIFAAALACGIVAAGYLSAASAASVRVDNSGSIQVDSCSVGRSGGATRGLNIVYHNTRRVAADEVIFRVDYRGVTRTIADAGTFSQDASINHDFSVFDAFGYEGPNPNSCVVTYVHFTDGQSWRI